MQEKLKDCPFCGEKAKLISIEGDFREQNTYCVACTSCRVSTKMFCDKDSAY